MTDWVYGFGAGDEHEIDRDQLGGKGASLAEMARMGLPVPPGITIIADVCRYFYDHDRQFPPGLKEAVAAGLARVEEAAGRKFGASRQPLLLSVRSGSRVSMPGMMDTILNLGLNDETVLALAEHTGDARFAWDSYRRFIQMYSDVALGLDQEVFEDLLEERLSELGHSGETQLTAGQLEDIVASYKELLRDELDFAFPQDPFEQLWGAIAAVFSSWKSARAEAFRVLHNIPVEWGTAVNIQAMVFGNLGNGSATGVAFTRNPSTGENALYGEFLVNAQGEDVVAGIRTPQSVTEAGRVASGSEKPSLEKLMPEAFAELKAISTRLERHYGDLQDMEFTIERGKLWMLQTRRGKRAAGAAVKIALDMADEGLISRSEAIVRVDPATLDQMLHPTIRPEYRGTQIGSGLPASPGAVTGEIVFTAEEAIAAKAENRKVILVRTETSPEDIHGMTAAIGVLTTRGGMTSHAAVVARGMGVPCVTGAGNMRVDRFDNILHGVGGVMLHAGDKLTIDGATGRVLKGVAPTQKPALSEDFQRLMVWADAARRMRVRTNADTPGDARAAREFGAEGIGLCRTEHMFFDGGRIHMMRRMILAETEEGRRAALDQLLPMQRDDFEALFSIMHGMPVTIRLLDPPLHEFLPKTESEIDDVAVALGMDKQALRHRLDALYESNPMLGHRGCRLAISYPEIAEMQARAIFEAAIAAARTTGEAVVPEIMVPLVSLKAELDYVKARVDAVGRMVMSESGMEIEYLVGTMVELPRAALRAHEIAETSAFFSMGTNDLTQTTFGLSRDDAPAFLGTYQKKGIIERDPFVSLDFDGVGELIRLAVERGRLTKPELQIGICGEHGGDPVSIRFCEGLALDYVSCSPFRVPTARLAAAQATIRESQSASR